MQGRLHVQKERSLRYTSNAVLILALLLAVGMLSLTGCSSVRSAMEGIDQTTPEATLLNLYQAVNRQDVARLKALIDKDDENAELAVRAFEALMASGLSYEITDVEFDMIENDGHRARLRTHYNHKIKLGDETLEDGRGGDAWTLVNKSGRWYLTGLGQSPPPGWLLEQ